MKKNSPSPFRHTFLLSELKAVAPEGVAPRLEQLCRQERLLHADGKSIDKRRRVLRLLIKFMSTVAIMDGLEGCWIWPGASPDGVRYPSLRGGGRSIQVHRLSHIVFKGDPHPFVVCHTCDTPACFNPSHLFRGTTADNNRDRQAKGRTRLPPRGQNHRHAKLTEDQVKEILRENPVMSRGLVSELARKYKVSRSAIQGILYGYTWKYLTLKDRVPFKVPEIYWHWRGTKHGEKKGRANLLPKTKKERTK